MNGNLHCWRKGVAEKVFVEPMVGQQVPAGFDVSAVAAAVAVVEASTSVVTPVVVLVKFDIAVDNFA